MTSRSAQQRNGRRGSVFAVRLTDEERERLESMQAQGGGPRALGPWLVWRACAAAAAVVPALRDVGVVPARAGNAAPGEVLPGPGNARARVVPGRGGRGRGTTAAGGDRAGTTPTAARLVLDLCAGSGSWSRPYELAGYRVQRVSLPGDDVRTFRPPSEPVWGILAAPPCDQFSLARNGHETPRDFLRGLECVNACLRIVQQCAPRWWALENPVGLLSRWLGTPRDVWEPCDFGDPWTKRTAIWGSYVLPTRGPFVTPVGGGPLCRECDPSARRTSWCNSAAHRAVTPPGFARAFFEANP